MCIMVGVRVRFRVVDIRVLRGKGVVRDCRVGFGTLNL